MIGSPTKNPNKEDLYKEYFARINECLESRSIGYNKQGFYLLCRLLSHNVPLDKFKPLITKHISSPKSQVEILSQMFFAQYYDPNDKLCLETLKTLMKQTESPNEIHRIHAVKTLSNINHPDIIQKLIQVAQSDKSPLVKKASLIGASYRVSKSGIDSNNLLIIVLIKSFFKTEDPILVSGAILSSHIIKIPSLIQEFKDSIWPLIYSLDPWSQSQAIPYLPDVNDHKPILFALLHSQNPIVVLETVKRLPDEPEKIIPPLLRLTNQNSIISIHAFSALESVSLQYPQYLQPYSSYFLPLNNSIETSYLSVKILGNIDCTKYLLNWALYERNIYAAHLIGKKKDENCLRTLLENGTDLISEIASFYSSKINNEEFLVNLLNVKRIRSTIVAVFTEISKENPKISELMLENLLSKYNELERDVKNEAALLSVRLIDCAHSDCANEFFDKCLNDVDEDIRNRAKTLKYLLESGPNLRKAIWNTSEPPNPAPPYIFL
ncbi:ARM repeat-containing protein [Histomonas meleagridis]|uniref:ARM repeat-containing protein n=1 Tax=Histomonas meleagridis TaxID=135588 RepID=UPI003559378A|nr:ARM repeat-containing protein [Histomonas meleagridis]KAH0797761.1 ARM repeat-containing protein [Histomonas meleagridis]